MNITEAIGHSEVLSLRGLMTDLSNAVSCSKRKREVEPQCCCVDVRVSNPTRDEITCKSASVKREDARASPSELLLSLLFSKAGNSSGVSTLVNLEASEEPALAVCKTR